MAKVISMYSKTQLNKPNKQIDDAANSCGVYIGCLPKDEAEAIRQLQEQLVYRQEIIEELITIYSAAYNKYLEDALQVLMYFKIDPNILDPQKNTLCIGEDGNAWIVPLPKGDENKQ